MVARVRIRDVRVLAACLPVKLPGLNDNAAKSCSVTTDELCSRMNHYVCTMLDRADKERCSERIVNNNRKSLGMCDLGDSIYIRDVAVGVSECLYVYRSRIIFYRTFDLGKVVCVHKSCPYAVKRKCMCQKIIRSAVNGLLRHDMSAACCKRLYRISNRCGSGCKCQSCASSFKCRYPVFKNSLGGVGESSVDVSRISQ